MLLLFHNPSCAYNRPYNLHHKFVPLLQSTFISLHHPYTLYTLTKLSLQSPLTLPSYMLQKFFTSPFLHATNPIIYNKIFSLPQPFSLFRLLQGIKELCSLVTNNTVLISSFFLKVWTVITGLAITNSLLLRLRKLVCYG